MSKSAKKEQPVLFPCYDISNKTEICIDEAGRGPLFGRVYIAAVVLPSHGFDATNIKDSKKFTSKKKIKEVAQYIKEHCLAWSIQCIDADVIDKINILQAVYKGMHQCIHDLLQNKNVATDGLMIVVDGDRFKPYMLFDESSGGLKEIPNVTIEQGDAKYIGIASASILAKVERDEYVEKMCAEYPQLAERYKLDKNMGYGTKQHLDGIKEHGVTQWHRRTFGLCKEVPLNPITENSRQEASS